MSVKSKERADAFDPLMDVHSLNVDDVIEIFALLPADTHIIDALSDSSLFVEVVKEKVVIETFPSCT